MILTMTADIPPDIDESNVTPIIVERPSSGLASLLDRASNLLIRLGLRAAQNHAVYCLDEWIADPWVPLAAGRSAGPGP